MDKRALLIIPGIGGVFALGYFSALKIEGPELMKAGERNRPLPTKSERRQERAGAAANERRLREERTNIPRPFPPGGAKDWLLEIAKNGRDSNIVETIQVIQQCSVLDEPGVRELLEVPLMLDEEGLELDGNSSIGVLFGSIFRFSQLNPKAALDFVNANHEELGGNEVLSVVYSKIAVEDPEAAAAARKAIGEEE